MAALSSARRLAASLTATLRAPHARAASLIHEFPSLHQRHLHVPPSRLQEPAPPATTSSSPSRLINSTPRGSTNAPVRNLTPRQPPPSTERSVAANPPTTPIRDLSTTGLSDAPLMAAQPDAAVTQQVDWTQSFHGLSSQAFSAEAQAALLAPIALDDIEVKPDGIIYLPEIKYRRILNKAFGPGGWGLAPRGETIVTAKSVTREYALVASGRLVSIARGEQDYFDTDGIPTATEGCKSNALMRCCKDLGVASELWDPRFIRKYFEKHAKEVWVEHVVSKKRKKVSMRRDDQVRYPFKEVQGYGST